MALHVLYVCISVCVRVCVCVYSVRVILQVINSPNDISLTLLSINISLVFTFQIVRSWISYTENSRPSYLSPDQTPPHTNRAMVVI